jgi:hypothetical protein
MEAACVKGTPTVGGEHDQMDAERLALANQSIDMLLCRFGIFTFLEARSFQEGRSPSDPWPNRR